MSLYRTATIIPNYLFDIWKGQRELPEFCKGFINLGLSFQIDIIQWTKSLIMITIWTNCWIIDTTSRPLDPLKWWLSLCYEAYENLNKPTYITLRFSKKTFPSFDKRLCLWSSYQVEGNSLWLGAPTFRGSNRMFKKTEDKYKKLHPSWSHSKIYKSSFLPRKGLAVSIFIVLIMILCFIPPILAAMFKINKVKVFGTPKVALVNVQVLNTQDEEKNYFSNFDSDTKFAVVDNSANVHI